MTFFSLPLFFLLSYFIEMPVITSIALVMPDNYITVISLKTFFKILPEPLFGRLSTKSTDLGHL